MVIGNGLLAKTFNEYIDNEQIIIFASGVSNSNEENSKAFIREKELLEKTIKNNKSKTLIYFSSCDVIYSNKLNKKYYFHKLEMEDIIKKQSIKYFIFRLPQLIGQSNNKNSLMNFLIDSIVNKKEIQVWENAYKNLVDVNDVKKMVEYILKECDKNQVINLINKDYYSIKNIIDVLEEKLSVSANIKLVKKGFKPKYERNLLLNEIEIIFDNNYLFQSIEKNYFTND